MVTKQEYEAEIKRIEGRHEVGKAVDGIKVLQFYVRTDSSGQSYLIGKTHQSALPLFYLKIEPGLPPVLVKEDAEHQISQQEREKAALHERLLQEKIMEDVRKDEHKAQAAAEKERAKLYEAAKKKNKGFLEKLIGGK